MSGGRHEPCCSHRAPGGEGEAATIRVGGDEAVFVSTDVSKTADVEAMRALRAAGAPLGCLGTAEEFTDLAVFLASDESRYCTGGFCMVDGGMTVL